MKKQTKEIIDFTKELVEIPSQNGIDSEKKIAKAIKEKLISFGFSPKIIGSKKHSSVYCKINNNPKAKTIWLESSLDTVPVGNRDDWNTNPLKATIKGTRMYGRGVADAKIGIAIFCYLAKELDKNKGFNGNLILGFDADEQSGRFTGIKDILKQKPEADICILGYQGIDEISIGARGWLRLKITTKGKSAHTGLTKKSGVNAIHQMAEIIFALKGLELSKNKESFFEFGSNVNVSLIKGGTAINVVPDKCEIKVDIRVIPSQTKKQILKEIKDKLTDIKTGKDIDYKVDVLQYKKAFLTNPDNEFIKILQNIAQSKLNTKIPLVASGAGSVGNEISKINIPIVNCFGCLSDNVHAPNEWVDISTVDKVFEIYKDSILKYSSSNSF